MAKSKPASKSLPTSSLIAYGQFGLVIAFAGLPIYVHAPKFYADTMGLPLALLGLLLFIPRLADALIDPLIGLLSDRYAAAGTPRLKLMAYAAPVLGLSFFALFAVPVTGQGAVGAWMLASVFFVYLSYSVLLINMNALGAELSNDYHERTRVAAWRESCFIGGLLVASALPPILQSQMGPRAAFMWFGAVFALLLLCGMLVLRAGLQRTKPARPKKPSAKLFQQLKTILLTEKDCRFLFSAGLMNATASAIPAALILFYVDDVLNAKAHEAGFLATYFLAGAFGMPVWVKLSRHMGKRAAWVASMWLAIAAFAWAFFLGAGDVTAFYVICLLAGLSLGADYTLPLSLLADIINPQHKKQNGEAGVYMGLWVLNAKLSTALSTAIALPLLAALGYQAAHANTPEALTALAGVYALLPCLFKMVAALLLHLSPLDRKVKV